MKAAIAQISTDPGKLADNTAKIIRHITQARALGADLVIFPELTIPGYLMLDLAHRRDFVQANKRALDEVAAACTGIAAIVGFLDYRPDDMRPGGRPLLYNSAAVLADGRIAGVQTKSLLPDYDIFFEERYFVPGTERRLFEIAGSKIGVQICEDLWDEGYSSKVTRALADAGAELIVNLSASPFEIGKFKERRRLVEGAVSRHKIPFIYVNLVGSFDGYEGEVIFDGRSLAYASNGTVIADCAAFEEELRVIDTSRNQAQSPLAELSWQDECAAGLAMGIREYFRRAGARTALVGLSGGIDSSLVACLAVQALGAENVIAVTMPSHVTAEDTLSDAHRTASNLGIKIIERSIAAEYRAWLADFKAARNTEPSSVTKQNKQARIRCGILMEYANELPHSLVLNTGNKTEFAVGYCTLYGDMCGALAVLGDVSKARVYELSRYLNAREKRELIPSSVIDRVPTAELEEGQTDRANLPADYPVLSPLVDRIIEVAPPLTELLTQYPEEVVRRTIRLIELAEFKRRQAPPALRITGKAFGVGRRTPMGVLSY